MNAEQPEPAGLIISRIYATWADDQVSGPTGRHEDHEHTLLVDVPAAAANDLYQRTGDALRAAGYSSTGRVLPQLTHQQVKAHVNAFLAADGADTAAGAATRIGPVWYVAEIDPTHPDELLLGRSLVVFDDGTVYPVGSLPPEYEVRHLLDRLDPDRRRLRLTEPWSPGAGLGDRGRAVSSGSGRTGGSTTRS